MIQKVFLQFRSNLVEMNDLLATLSMAEAVSSCMQSGHSWGLKLYSHNE